MVEAEGEAESGVPGGSIFFHTSTKDKINGSGSRSGKSMEVEVEAEAVKSTTSTLPFL